MHQHPGRYAFVICAALLFFTASPMVFAADSSLENESISDMDALTKKVDAELKKISALMESQDQLLAGDIESSIDASFECDPLRPGNAQEIYRNQQVTVHRATPPFHQTHEGATGFALAINDLKKSHAALGHVKIKFKTIRVGNDGDLVNCRALLHYTASSDEQVIEQSADWSLQWTFADIESPRLISIELNDYEETKTHRGQGKWFNDCTESVFDSVPSFSDQILKGTRDWRRELTAGVEVDFVGQIGIAVGDVNGDDREDVFLCQPNGVPNRLYAQQSDGTLQDISATAGIDWLDTTRGALLIDLDNDGDQDLVCCIPHHVLFMENDGKGVFQLRASPEGPIRGYSLCSADPDRDGDLDVYVCGYVRYENFLANPGKAIKSIPRPYHDARNGGPNFFFRNEGDFQFVDATEETGLSHNNNRFSHAAVWEDLDNDGDMDLYVANDFGRNNLYRNTGGKFKDVAAESLTEDMAAGMGIAIEDFNKDGLMDIYVSNMFSAAGNRTTRHHTFKDSSSEEVRNAFRRHARGNTLLQNAGDGTFKDVSESAGVTLGRWAWSCNFIDMNNDGWHDLFVANGYVTNEDTRDL